MGAKQSRTQEGSVVSLNPAERRRLTVFLESRGSVTQFNRQYMEGLWKELLVPDLLKSYSDYLMTQDTRQKNFIGMEEFVLIYRSLVRGGSEDKVSTLSSIIGVKKNGQGEEYVSYNALIKYLSDLLESYFLGLKHRDDNSYKSWTHLSEPKRRTNELVMKGVTAELPRKNDQVMLQDLDWLLTRSGVISVLHSYVLGSLYNLDPEFTTTVIPEAVLPTSRTGTFLDLAQVVYLNSFVPSENKAIWRFLFSMSTYGESYSKLISCITKQGPVMIVVKSSDGHVFGGFATDNLSLSPKWGGTSDCFLFTLEPAVEVFHSTGYNDHYVYINANQTSFPNGVGMGGQFNYWGLWIDSHFGEGECSESCTTYTNYKMLASKKKFHIAKLEVWGVGEPPPTASEKGERETGGDKSILDRDSATTHMMDLAGRKQYSKGLRETCDET